MVLAKSTGLLWLLIVQIMAATSLVAGQGLDLNETPEEEEFQDASETFSSPLTTTTSTATTTTIAPQKSPSSSRAKGNKITSEFYAKVEKLFKILQICDDEHFDINKMELPDSISPISKAMMALEKVGRSNLIKKSDKPKYNRIMANCAKLTEAVNVKTESKLSIDSQLSGGTWEERLSRLRDSVLDNLRDRFTGPAAPLPTSSPVTTTTPETTTEKPMTSLTRLQGAYDVSDFGTAPERRFIQFF